MSNFIMFLSLLLRWTLSSCTYRHETGADLTRFSRDLKAGEEVCIAANLPRLYLMMYKAPDVEITAEEYDTPTSTLPTKSTTFTGDTLTAYLFPKIGRVTFTAQRDTKLVFSAIELDSACADRIWFSTFPNENFLVPDTLTKNPDYALAGGSETCVFFSAPGEIAHTVVSRAGIDSASRIEIHQRDKDVETLSGKTFRRDVISESAYFKVAVDSKPSYGEYFRILTGEYEEKATVPFRGFQGDGPVPHYAPTSVPQPGGGSESAGTGSSKVVTKVILSVGIVFIVVAIAVIFVAMNRRRRKDKYISVPSVQINF